MILFLIIGAVVWVLLRHHRKNVTLPATPLGGVDTGVRSPFRTPGRFFKPRRGF